MSSKPWPNRCVGPFSLKTFSLLKDYFGLGFSGASHEQAKLNWIVRLRWLVISFLTGLIPFGFVSGVLTHEKIGIYTVVLISFFCFNLLSFWGWFKKGEEVKSGHIAFQLIVDLAVLAGLLLLTGGIFNPFYIVFFINVSLGATLLDGRWSFVFLFLCHQALLLVQVATYFAETESHLLSAFIIQHLVLQIAWGVSRSLGRYISVQQEKLLQVKIYAEKIDRLRALGAMAAGFSHEFTGPLSTVKLRLNREMRAHPQSKNLQDMNLAVLECESVIRQMNSAQMDPRDFQFQVFSLSSATNKILRSWLHENPLAKTELNINTKDDDVRLPVLNYSQALMNILDNAFEANPEGHIVIAMNPLPSKVVLSVENSGSSFSEDVLQRFGEPFVTTKTTGTGLGLYSVQLFAQASGGKAFISNSKVGAKVEIHIPHVFEKSVSL